MDIRFFKVSIQLRPEVQVVRDMYGWGYREKKLSNYEWFINRELFNGPVSKYVIKTTQSRFSGNAAKGGFKVSSCTCIHPVPEKLSQKKGGCPVKTTSFPK